MALEILAPGQAVTTWKRAQTGELQRARTGGSACRTKLPPPRARTNFTLGTAARAGYRWRPERQSPKNPGALREELSSPGSDPLHPFKSVRSVSPRYGEPWRDSPERHTERDGQPRRTDLEHHAGSPAVSTPPFRRIRAPSPWSIDAYDSADELPAPGCWTGCSDSNSASHMLPANHTVSLARA